MILDPLEFYQAALKENGITPVCEEIEKFASSNGLDVETAKLAKAYFEQMQLDKIPYTDETARANDAMKMAESYFAHVKESEQAAVKLADGLLRFLTHEVEGYLAKNNIDLSPREALKIAGLQADSAIEFEKKAYEVHGGAPAAASGGENWLTRNGQGLVAGTLGAGAIGVLRQAIMEKRHREEMEAMQAAQAQQAPVAPPVAPVPEQAPVV